MATPAIFLDKDGTLIDDVPYNVDPSLMRLARGIGELPLLREGGYRLVVVSNQPGVAHGMYPCSALNAVERRLREMLTELGVSLDGVYWCLHHPEGKVREYARVCECRKPAPGLLRQASRDLDLDLARSWMIGDILDDVEAGIRA